MLNLKQHLKEELSQAIVDHWIDTPKKYIEMIEQVQEYGTWNATTVFLEESWCYAEKLVDQSFNLLLKELFPYIHQAIEKEFAYFIHSVEVRNVQGS